MADEEKVTFRAAAWSMLAARDLSKIADATEHDIQVYAREVGAGRWQLLEILVDGERKGCVVHSVEQEGARHSLIINAAAVETVQGVDVTGVMLRLFRGIARQSGAYALRCWTSRPGLVRKLERVGASRRYVMELETEL